MRSRRSLVFAAWASVCTAVGPATAQVLYIDPVAGVDTPAGGSSASPLRTMTFALNLASGGAVPLELRLLPGTYSESSGEDFPLNAPAHFSVTSVVPWAARVTPSAPVIQPIFELAIGTQHAVFEGLDLAGFGMGIRSVLGFTDTAAIEVRDCRVSCSRGIVLDVTDGVASLLVSGSVFNGGDRAIRVIARAAAQVTCQLERSVVRLAVAGVELVAEGQGGRIDTLLQQTVVSRSWLQGLRTEAHPGATLATRIESSAFHRNAKPGSANQGAIIDFAVGGLVAFDLRNSAFSANGQDIQLGMLQLFTLSHCLFQDPALCTLPGSGNVCGDPMFVDPDAGDFHVRPGSPLIDSGALGATTPTVDIDGDPRPGHPLLASPALPDIGPDEVYFRHYQPSSNTVPLGQLLTLRLVGPPGSAAALLLGAQENGQPFGPALRLSVPLLLPPLFVGIVPPGAPAGELVAQAFVPELPALVGITLFAQAAFGTPTGVAYGYNVVEHGFRP